MDSINRQAAINAIDKYNVFGYVEEPFEKLEKALLELPSAQPEQRWIPCSERLPAGQEEVIVSCCDDAGDSRFDYTASGWVTTDGEYWIVDNEINHYVIAWMPLPEPYKERRTDEDN